MINDMNAAAVLVGSLLALAGAAWKIWRAQQAAIIRAHETAQVLDKVRAEFDKNHGSSLRDAIDRMEYSLEDLHERHARLEAAQGESTRRIDGLFELVAGPNQVRRTAAARRHKQEEE